jgi:MoaA/NifB/PqqE/SkfB family radical SAM enzyme
MLKFDEIKKLHLELSTACNAACPVCPRNIAGGINIPYLKTNTFTYNDFVNIFDASFIKQLVQILLVGRYGDPAVCSDLIKILEYVYSINDSVYINMHTNGSLRTPDWWATLAIISKFKNLKVIFSIDGLEDTNHIYGRNVNWHRLMSNVTAFISNGGNATWEFLVFKHNQHQINDAKILADNLNFNEFILKRPYGFSSISANTTAINVIDENGKHDYLIEPADDNYKNAPYQAPIKQITGGNYSVQQYINDRTGKIEIVDEYYDSVNIDCHAVKEKEIYIDALYNVHPCCWLAYAGQDKILPDANEVKYSKWIAEEIGLDYINAKKNTLREIVESLYFQKIEDSWKKTHADGRFSTCTQMCGKINNVRKELFVNDKIQ